TAPSMSASVERTNAASTSRSRTLKRACACASDVASRYICPRITAPPAASSERGRQSATTAGRAQHRARAPSGAALRGRRARVGELALALFDDALEGSVERPHREAAADAEDCQEEEEPLLGPAVVEHADVARERVAEEARDEPEAHHHRHDPGGAH